MEITIENASRCTPYELRQELLRRNAFDLDERTCNYRTMLQRLMVELVKEEENKKSEVTSKKLEEYQHQRDALKLEREKKKQEALERSKLRRQQDPDYFVKKSATSTSTAILQPPEILGQEEENEENARKKEQNDECVDIFRCSSSTGRSKIYVK